MFLESACTLRYNGCKAKTESELKTKHTQDHNFKSQQLVYEFIYFFGTESMNCCETIISHKKYFIFIMCEKINVRDLVRFAACSLYLI